jgi:hypothetical protein
MAVNLTFQGPKSYDHLVKSGEPVTFKHGGKQFVLPTVVIPKGAIFHRADHEGAREPSNAVPAFFGNRETIRPYAREKGEEAYSSYRVKSDMRLFEMGLNSVYDLFFHPSLNDTERQIIQMYVDPDEGYVIPTELTGNAGPTGHIPYLNRDMANIVCRLGFDGWIVFPFHFEKRKGLLEYSLHHEEVRKYPPEILVCNWKTHMERIPSGGRSNTRRRRSKARSTRKK